jgi:hypothetical protein
VLHLIFGGNSSIIDVVAGETYFVSYKRKYISGDGKTNIYFRPKPLSGEPYHNIAVSEETSGNWVTVTDS